MRIRCTASRLRCSRSTAAKNRSPAIGREVILVTMGRTPFTTRRCTGKMRSMYQLMTSGNERRRSVSAVGAQSTTRRSYRLPSTCVLTSMRLKISSRPGITDSSSAWIVSTPAHPISWTK